jgi:hypothetical protein
MKICNLINGRSSLGKGEVESSILSCSTIFPLILKGKKAKHSPSPSEWSMKFPLVVVILSLQE